MEHYPEDWDVWVNDPINMIFPGGESVQEMCNRVQSTFARIEKQYHGKTVMIFTHCTPIRTMITKWKGQPIRAINDLYFPYNASVTIVRYEDDGSYTIELESYDEHLKQAGLHHENIEERR
jgi:probable phosphoglycerate mutase